MTAADASMRVIDVVGGPHDGHRFTVAAGVALPETISFPVLPLRVKRHVYRRVEDAAGVSTYRYDRMEVGA